ncbi:hypothetical protein Tco_1450168 [Tanacetum coccineum]
MKCPQHYLTEMQEVILFYNGLDVPTRQILNSRGGGYKATAPGCYQRNNTNPSFQEQRQSMENTQSKFMSKSAKRHEENSNLIKEIRASTDAFRIRNQETSNKTLKNKIGQMTRSDDKFERKNELDLEARLMEDIGKSRRKNLMPTIEEGEVIEEFRTRDEDLDTGIEDYPSYCEYDKSSI